jgi:hypothetical protein
LKPYWGKPAVRNFRGDDGNVGIIRSPVRAIVLPGKSLSHHKIPLTLRTVSARRRCVGPMNIIFAVFNKIRYLELMFIGRRPRLLRGRLEGCPPPRTVLGARGGSSPGFVTFGLALMLILAACGGEGGPSSPPTAALSGTLAYVLSECRDTKQGYFFRQSLQIRQGDREPITLMQVPEIGPIPDSLQCYFPSIFRLGGNSARRGAVQRLAVSADGATVAFELSDDFSIVARNFLPPAQKGIFVVRADGSGLHRLGPPSRQASWVSPPGWYFNDLSFSPDGRTLTFPDLGPGPDGETSQIFLQDVATGKRAQITHLPTATPAADLPPRLPSAWLPFFLDDQTVAFGTDANIDGANPEGEWIGATVKRDGSSLKVLPEVALPGSQINPTFIITGDRPAAVGLAVPGEPVNHPPDSGLTSIFEVFLVDGDNVLQLTDFHRADTGIIGLPFIGVDRQTVFFGASADPFGKNPSEECQVFSIDRLGGNLRQLTRFRETDHSVHGCDFGVPVGSGCATYLLGQDVRTQAMLFYSSCDPLGTNPNGGQIFAMRPDGADLRQLTNARGLVTEAGGTVIGELPGPFGFSSGPR